jgi:flagellar motor switch protein FliM
LVLETNLEILFLMIKIIGVKRKDFNDGRQTITDIERTLIQGIINLALRDVEEAWKPINKFKISVVAVETSPQLIQITVPSEQVLATSFEIKVGEVKGFMSLCIPCVILEPITKKLNNPDIFAKKGMTSLPYLRSAR